MWQRVVAVLVMIGVVAGVIAVAHDGSSPVRTAGDLPKLPSASSSRSGEQATAKDAIGSAAPAAASSMLAPLGMDVTVSGTLPDLGTTAPAYRMKADVTSDDVATLASALGVKGAVKEVEGAYVVTGADSVLRVEKTGIAGWTMYPTNPSDNCSVSSDGATICQGSGSASASSSGVAQPAIACATPPCAPNSDCPAPETKCAVPPQPTTTTTRPADLPSQGDAEQAASALFSKAAVPLEGAKVTTIDGGSSWFVTLTPAIDGKPVSGLVATASIGPKGKVQSATGWLAKPVKLGNYPLVGTAAAIDRLKNGQFIAYGYSGIATAAAADSAAKAQNQIAVQSSPVSELTAEEAQKLKDNASGGASSGTSGGASAGSSGAASGSGGGSTSSPTSPALREPVPISRTKVTVTGAHLELALVGGAGGTVVLVPVYAFETAAGVPVPLVAAVPDSLLEQQVQPAKGAPTPATEPVITPATAVAPRPETIPVQSAPAQPTSAQPTSAQPAPAKP